MNKNFKKIIFVFFLFQAFFLISKEVMVDSIEELFCLLKQENGAQTLIIIDLFDVGIEYKNELLHQENKSKAISILKEKLPKYKVKNFLAEKELEGLNEIKSFFEFYLSSNNILLITDKSGYIPSNNYEKIKLTWDSYKNGVIFYKSNLWIKIIELVLQKYKKIIFVSSNKNKIRKFQEVFKTIGYTILCKNIRKKLNILILEKMIVI